MTPFIFFVLLFFDFGVSAPPLSPARAVTDSIARYFHDGYQYRMILVWLGLLCGVSVSLATLKRIIRELGLRRRVRTSMEYFAVVEALMRVSLSNIALCNYTLHLNLQIELLQGSGGLLGYRTLWQRLRQKYRLPVARYNANVIL